MDDNGFITAMPAKLPEFSKEYEEKVMDSIEKIHFKSHRDSHIPASGHDKGAM